MNQLNMCMVEIVATIGAFVAGGILMWNGAAFPNALIAFLIGYVFLMSAERRLYKGALETLKEAIEALEK